MKLDAAARKQIPTTDFALADRRYPIEDQGHAQAALSMVSRYGSPEEQGIVRKKVKEKYGMGESHKDALVKKLQGGA